MTTTHNTCWLPMLSRRFLISSSLQQQCISFRPIYSRMPSGKFLAGAFRSCRCRLICTNNKLLFDSFWKFSPSHQAWCQCKSSCIIYTFDRLKTFRRGWSVSIIQGGGVATYYGEHHIWQNTIKILLVPGITFSLSLSFHSSCGISILTRVVLFRVSYEAWYKNCRLTIEKLLVYQ